VVIEGTIQYFTESKKSMKKRQYNLVVSLINGCGDPGSKADLART
jgi:hypothetical protein